MRFLIGHCIVLVYKWVKLTCTEKYIYETFKPEINHMKFYNILYMDIFGNIYLISNKNKIYII